MKITDKGFNSDAIIVINHWGDRDGKTRVFAESVKHLAGIDKVILQGNSPMGFAHAGLNFTYKDNNHMLDLPVSFDSGDDNFIPFYRMKIIAGRNMIFADSMKELVINETCSRAMGFSNPANAVGKFLFSGANAYPVVGVVADFHEGNFHEKIRPVVIGKGREWSVAIRLSAGENKIGDIKTLLSRLEGQWKNIYPDDGFNYSFLDESIVRLFDQEAKTAWLVDAAMIITIFISCMGLFGLAKFTAERRTKEIGIRKVLGASAMNIVGMLSKDFVQLVLIAILIASPVAWYFMRQWLQDFAYRVDIGWTIFLIASCSAILIALLTVSFQAVKAALANPVRSLRAE